MGLYLWFGILCLLSVSVSHYYEVLTFWQLPQIIVKMVQKQ